jgi:very-short-patch-repair endonuclease
MPQSLNNPAIKDTRRRLRREWTRAEQILWLALRDRKLDGVKFRRQVSIGSFILDFYASEIKLAIEADGASHDSKAGYDKWRQSLIEDSGVTFLRFTDREINNSCDKAVDQIRLKVAELRSNQ